MIIVSISTDPFLCVQRFPELPVPLASSPFHFLRKEKSFTVFDQNQTSSIQKQLTLFYNMLDLTLEDVESTCLATILISVFSCKESSPLFECLLKIENIWKIVKGSKRWQNTVMDNWDFSHQPLPNFARKPWQAQGWTRIDPITTPLCCTLFY